ncbi:MAG: Alcohol dehydrogenase zinc-binding domain protein [Myxococcales bacterium]|nr:Alcohol dehydrogenase zinc-binding domain protein [Myxococcales bacterium]
MAMPEKETGTERVKGRAPVVLPDTMLAAAVDEFGPPEVLTPHTLPVPRVGQSEIAIALHGAGVGIWDAKIRDGTWAPDHVSFPLVLGTDGAGIVIAKGALVRRFEIGDRVWSYAYQNPKGGYYAEYVVIDANNAGHVPPQLDLFHAGVAVVTALTALQGIEDHLHVRADQRVLIFGASGAVGTYAVQLAKHRGAFVIGTATGSDAQELVSSLGADAVIDARDGLARLEQVAAPGLDAVLALAGGDALERCLDHVREGGRVAYPDGVEPPPAHRPRFHVVAYDAIPGPRELARLSDAFVAARLRVPVAAEFPLERAADAHRRLEQGHVLGRIGLRIGRPEDRLDQDRLDH